MALIKLDFPEPIEPITAINSDFLTEKNVENSDKMISLIVQNPQMTHQVFPEVVDFYCKKYNILTLNTVVSGRLNPIMYYE